jgi:hypothetical protein
MLTMNQWKAKERWIWRFVWYPVWRSRHDVVIGSWLPVRLYHCKPFSLRFISFVSLYGQIDLDSPKVATMDEIEKGKKVYCRCWLSGTFPLCDGTHQVRFFLPSDCIIPVLLLLFSCYAQAHTC